MDFFESQESLTIIEWILRSIFSFFYLLVITKLMGQRSISQLRFLDFVIALILGNILAHPLSDEELGLKGSLITTSVLIVLYVTVTLLSLKWPLLKRYLDPPPIDLIKNGQVQFQNLSTARISIDYLFSELRKGKVEDVQKVARAIWEPGGTISIFLDTQYQPLTPADMKLETLPFNLNRPIIYEGKIDMKLLQEIEKDFAWLKDKIGPNYREFHEVPLATIDEKENVRVYTDVSHH